MGHRGQELGGGLRGRPGRGWLPGPPSAPSFPARPKPGAGPAQAAPPGGPAARGGARGLSPGRANSGKARPRAGARSRPQPPAPHRRRRRRRRGPDSAHGSLGAELGTAQCSAAWNTDGGAPRARARRGGRPALSPATCRALERCWVSLTLSSLDPRRQ
jgi:hypothetical protein